jgi:hypothetical protein
METKSLKDLGDHLFSKEVKADVKAFIEKQPYLSFTMLSAILEFVARYYSGEDDWHKCNISKRICCELISNVTALEKYRQYTKVGDDSLLYTELRCGILHSLAPGETIKLDGVSNDVSKLTIGASDLYDDLEKAWVEVKAKGVKAPNGSLVIDGSTTAFTASNSSTQTK